MKSPQPSTPQCWSEKLLTWPPLGILIHGFQNVMRCWVMCCTNYHQLSAVILLFVSCVLAAGLLFTDSPGFFLNFLAPLILSFAAGSYLASRSFLFFLGRAQFLSAREFPQSELIENTGSATGIALLDTVLNENRLHIASIEGSIQEMQEEINLLQMRYSILTDNLAAAVIVHDEDGLIGYCSPYTEVLFGYPLSEIYESEQDFFLKIIHEEDKAMYKRALGYARMGEAYRYRFRFFHKSNIEMWAESRMVPIFDEQGNISSSLSVMIDVTQSVKYERQVEEKNHDLQDFSYMVSHDLKAPIVTIKGMLGILDDEGTQGLSNDSREALEHIGKAIGRLESLVVGILEYSKLSSRELSHEPVALDVVLEEVISDYRQQIKDSGAEIIVDQSMPQVRADRLGMYQVFSNLIGNALKYRSDERPLKVEIQLLSSDQRKCQLRIRDNGQGIPEDKHQAIFRPFQRAHAGKVEGSGIGLACVKKLVERFGGSVGLQKSDPQGSDFFLILPISRAEDSYSKLLA